MLQQNFKNKNLQKAIVFLCMALYEEDKTKKRRKWMKNWLKERNAYSHVKLLKELEINEFQDFKNYLRMDQNLFYKLLSLVKHRITKNDTLMRNAIPAKERLIATLRFLATGRNYTDLQYSVAISPASLSIIIPETCLAIFDALKEYIKFPENEAEWATIAKDFSQLWQFKNCVGAMDGKHIHIKKPPGTGSLFYNYKGTHSVVLFAVVNAKCEFIYINTGTNGRVSDGGILKRTNFYYKLQTKSLTLPPPVELEPNKPKVPFVFIGDDAFGLEENLMKPYKFSKTSREERIFNYRLSRARRVVENAFGILASRFRVLLTTINLNVENVDAVVLACCALHNFLKKENSEYAPARYIDHEDTESGTLIKGEWRNSGALLNIQQASPQNFPVEARNIRETFKEFFNGSGKLSFQERMISNDQKF